MLESKADVARAWMEIIRVVDSTPGVNISELARALKTTTLKKAHRLMVSGYIRCMVDLGILRCESNATRVRIYNNDGDFGGVVEDYTKFQRQLRERKRRWKERQRQKVEAAARTYRPNQMHLFDFGEEWDD